MFVSLLEAKAHLNILPDETIDDTYISDLIEVSENTVENYLGFPLSPTYTVETLPKSIKHGIKYILGNFYANRESISFAQGYRVPDTIDLLLNPYRIYNI